MQLAAVVPEYEQAGINRQHDWEERAFQNRKSHQQALDDRVNDSESHAELCFTSYSIRVLIRCLRRAPDSVVCRRVHSFRPLANPPPPLPASPPGSFRSHAASGGATRWSLEPRAWRGFRRPSERARRI